MQQAPIIIHLDTIPPTVTAQQKGERVITPKSGGKSFVHHFTKPKVKGAETLFLNLLAKHRIDQPIQGPTRVETTWIFPYRKSEPKRNIGKLLPHDKRPDHGNLQKLLDDCIVKAGFLADDGQISVSLTAKFWGQYPGIWINIIPL